MVIRRPIGVCAAITPYNFPLTLLGTKVAPALVAGNTVVAKPAATTPLTTLAGRRLFSEAGVPDGVLNVVTGRGSEIGDALVGHPDVRRVAFTGSTAVGRHVAALAAPELKRLTLELGGSDPVIVCADADVDAAVKAVIIGRYWNAARRASAASACSSTTRSTTTFVSQLVDRVGRYEPGDGTVKAEKPKLRMGPIHTRAGRDELLEQIEDGVDSGGELLIGGGTGVERQGLVPGARRRRRAGGRDSRLVREEVFGPVLPVLRFTRLRRRDRARQRHSATASARRSGPTTHA